MLPDLDEAGNLPPGIHEASWTEIATRYGYTAHRRRRLLAGLEQAIESLCRAGCRRIYIDGSFVTDKVVPADFDCCWEVAGVDPGLLDPVLLDFSEARRAQKQKFGGELFPAEVPADPAGTRFLDYFQRDRSTGAPKGIVALELKELP